MTVGLVADPLQAVLARPGIGGCAQNGLGDPSFVVLATSVPDRPGIEADVAVTDGEVEPLDHPRSSPSTAHGRLIDLWSCVSTLVERPLPMAVIGLYPMKRGWRGRIDAT